jgi:hypothetical protein
MLRIERSADGEDVRLTIAGRVEAVHVAELQRLNEEETAARRPIVLDLKEVKLVDREAVSFFVRCEAGPTGRHVPRFRLGPGAGECGEGRGQANRGATDSAIVPNAGCTHPDRLGTRHYAEGLG